MRKRKPRDGERVAKTEIESTGQTEFLSHGVREHPAVDERGSSRLRGNGFDVTVNSRIVERVVMHRREETGHP